MSAHDLSGRTAIVTGASRGIGLATARALLDAGANVVVTSREKAAADQAAASLGDRAVGIAAHVTDEIAARICIESTIGRFGSLDILVNNAGTNPAYGPLVEQNQGRVAKTFDVNVWGPLLWTQLAWHGWMADHGGAIVNTASVGALAVAPGLGAYNASKAALVRLTRQLAFELAPKVRVNAVAPGVVRTRLAEVLWREHEKQLNATTPLGRIGEPSDVAQGIVFLASDAASWVTGETFVIDGGQILGASHNTDEPSLPSGQ